MPASRTQDCLSSVCCALPARGIQAAFNWDISRKLWFGFLFVSIVCAKFLHIYAHYDSIPLSKLLLWGSTFFGQDALFLFAAHFVTRNFERRWTRILAAMVVVSTSGLLSVMAAANTSFFFTTGAEIHWRQAGAFNRDPASINTLLTGLTGLVVVEVIYFVVAVVTTPYIYNCVEAVIAIWASVLKALCGPFISFAIFLWTRRRKMFGQPKIYEPLPLSDYDEEENKLDSSASLLDHPHPPTEVNRSKIWTTCLKRGFVVVPTALFLLLRLLRPDDESYCFLSQTIIVSPFTGVDSEGKLASITADRWIDGKETALAATPKFDWLPEGEWPGFRDWEDSKYLHYASAEDPLHISNLENDVVQPLREVLSSGAVKIKHVMVFKMESTRQDVFPFMKDSYFHQRIKQSYRKKIPKDVGSRLASMTRTAERLTGSQSGFNEMNPVTPYGGISMTNSYTAGTFTLKSIEGTTCGVSPLVVDFNHEHEHHIYQPCMPHILDVLSARTNNSKSNNFLDWPWRSRFMQTITDSYDHQDLLTPALGFHNENILTMEAIDKQHTNDSSWTTEKYNFWGYADENLGDYLKDAIIQAEDNHERLFITHLTGLTHHPWDLPPGVEYEEMIGSIANSWGGKNDGLNHYLNTIAYNDRWYAKVLEILEETGVANETLFVLTGDHGVSLLEDGNVTPYDNPLVTNFHVPLVFAHPHLPALELNSSVTSIQILPTILDLLRESGSLPNQSIRAVNDLLPMYEGQSMIRRIIEKQDNTPYWQFTVMNTGGSMVAMRSADKPYRLIVPLVPETEWRFTDVKKDPREESPIKSFSLDLLISAVTSKHGDEAVEWVHDAARAAQWWVTDNWRRYEYDPSA